MLYIAKRIAVLQFRSPPNHNINFVLNIMSQNNSSSNNRFMCPSKAIEFDEFQIKDGSFEESSHSFLHFNLG